MTIRMPTPSYQITCTRKKQLTADVFELAFTKPEGFTFKPGQFVLFDVVHPDNASDIQPRAYSIASTPDESELLFVIKIIPGGRMSRVIQTTLDVGSIFTIKGPFGFFLLDPDPSISFALVCTGAGIAPFRSQLAAAIQSGDTRPIDLVFGNRTEADIFWKDELASLVAGHTHVRLHYALSKPSDAWTGLRGRVQSVLPSIVTNFSGKSLYACGNPDMTLEIKKLALEQWAMPKEKIHVEGYM